MAIRKWENTHYATPLEGVHIYSVIDFDTQSSYELSILS